MLRKTGKMNPTISFQDFVRTRHALWLQKTYEVPAETYVSAFHADMLSGFHLTNVWRELDRGTLAVINDLQLPSSTDLLAVHRTLLYRFFNSWNGYTRYMENVKVIGLPTVEECNLILDMPGNFSGAYIRTVKREIAIEALQTLYKHALAIANILQDHHLLDTWPEIEESKKKLRAAFGAIPSFGNFLADQLMLDFCWHGNPWNLAGFKPGLGPGAKRGLERMGMTFNEARAEMVTGLEGMPRPRIQVKTGVNESAIVQVPVTYVEVEHQLCEAEKLWKFQEAALEGEGRQVKMRKYKSVSPREKDGKPILANPLPKRWIEPAL